MNVITNVKINYMLLEQILRVTGMYKNLCDEHEFLDFIFKQTKTGSITSLFKDEAALNDGLEFIEKITGVSKKYWAGEERIKLGIRCKNHDGVSIDTIDLSTDKPLIKDKIVNSEMGKKTTDTGHAYHGLLYQDILKNPLCLEFETIYAKVNGAESSEAEIEKGINIVESLYSLRGLLAVILINMATAGEIELIDKANVYKRTDWAPYIRPSSKLTKQSASYSPKCIEIRKGLVQTMIKNILDLGYVVTFRNLDKSISF